MHILYIIRHSKEMIAKLESAGLGFSTNSSQVLQRLGKFEIMQQMNRLKKMFLTCNGQIFWDKIYLPWGFSINKGDN